MESKKLETYLGCKQSIFFSWLK